MTPQFNANNELVDFFHGKKVYIVHPVAKYTEVVVESGWLRRLFRCEKKQLVLEGYEELALNGEIYLAGDAYYMNAFTHNELKERLSDD